MSNPASHISIRTLFISSVMTITSLTLLAGTATVLYFQINHYKKEAKGRVSLYADIIGKITARGMVLGNNHEEALRLKAFEFSNFIENIHLYKITSDTQIKLFVSHNNPGKAPVPTMTDKIRELARAKQTDGFFEVIRPIDLEGRIIGYIYLRSTASIIDRLIFNSVAISLTVLLLMLLTCFLLTFALHQFMTRPLNDFVNLIQGIATNKDYSQRAESSNIAEVNTLSNAFNQLLDRVQDHMHGQSMAEEEHRRLTTNFEQKVNQRTQALKEANQELIETLEKLHEYQRQIVQNEKLASLGDMVAGVAHEVNTPIGLGVTSSTMMLDRLTNIRTDFDNKTLKASTLERFLDESAENLNIIYRNLNRTAELISSFKQVAVDQSDESSRTFAVKQLMEEILISLRPKLKNQAHHINLVCDPDLVIESKAGPINQIMINLIVNSQLHGFEDMKQGHININIELVGNNKLTITYSDNGKGIEEDLRSRIFDPFVTTKRGQGGSGLGLHLVYNLVTQALNGSIALTSNKGVGVNFIITFPVRRV